MLAPGLEISRIVTGLWQVADMERDGKTLDPFHGAAAMAEYARAGFDTFDMADHYGSAEVITGTLLASTNRPPVQAFTKWCPTPGPMTAAVVREGVGRGAGSSANLPHRPDAVSTGGLSDDPALYRRNAGTCAAARGRVDWPSRIDKFRYRASARFIERRHSDLRSISCACRCSISELPVRCRRFCLERGVRAVDLWRVEGGGFLSERWLDAARTGSGE